MAAHPEITHPIPCHLSSATAFRLYSLTSDPEPDPELEAKGTGKAKLGLQISHS